MIKTQGYAAYDATTALRPFDFERREPQADDVQIEILYCGVCHSDLHQARNEWGGSRFPMVPGHEIVGRVVASGVAVSRFNKGDWVGVGCLVDSCGTCPDCRQDQQQYCDQPVFTYSSRSGCRQADIQTPQPERFADRRIA